MDMPSSDMRLNKDEINSRRNIQLARVIGLPRIEVKLSYEYLLMLSPDQFGLSERPDALEACQPVPC